MEIGVIDDSGRVSTDLLRGHKIQKAEFPRRKSIVDPPRALSDHSKQLGVKKMLHEHMMRVMRGNSPDDWSSDEEVDVKATKRNGAKVQAENWNHELYRTMDIKSSKKRDIALDNFRKWMLCWSKTKSVALL